jgi:hypothetical protein
MGMRLKMTASKNGENRAYQFQLAPHHLPLEIYEKMHSIDLSAGSRDEEQKARGKERSRANKVYFVRLEIHKDNIFLKPKEIIPAPQVLYICAFALYRRMHTR